jgi:hypothetical protein
VITGRTSLVSSITGNSTVVSILAGKALFSSTISGGSTASSLIGGKGSLLSYLSGTSNALSVLWGKVPLNSSTSGTSTASSILSSFEAIYWEGVTIVTRPPIVEDEVIVKPGTVVHSLNIRPKQAQEPVVAPPANGSIIWVHD